MKQYNTFAETEALLLTAIRLPGRTTRAIAAATGIRADTLYKWKTTEVHLSPPKADALLLYPESVKFDFLQTTKRPVATAI